MSISSAPDKVNTNKFFSGKSCEPCLQHVVKSRASGGWIFAAASRTARYDGIESRTVGVFFEGTFDSRHHAAQKCQCGDKEDVLLGTVFGTLQNVREQGWKLFVNRLVKVGQKGIINLNINRFDILPGSRCTFRTSGGKSDSFYSIPIPRRLFRAIRVAPVRGAVTAINVCHGLLYFGGCKVGTGVASDTFGRHLALREAGVVQDGGQLHHIGMARAGNERIVLFELVDVVRQRMPVRNSLYRPGGMGLNLDK